MEEMWKDIKGYEGSYQISNFGRVGSTSRGPFRILKPSTRGGYKIINLQINKIKKSHSVHRLVGLHFIPNPNNYPEINHKDEIKSNNNFKNLEWCTKLYNANYGSSRKKIKLSLSKITHQYTLDGKLVNIWDSTREAGRNGFQSSHIASCCRGERKTHSGYIWKYEEDVINGR